LKNEVDKTRVLCMCVCVFLLKDFNVALYLYGTPGYFKVGYTINEHVQ